MLDRSSPMPNRFVLPKTGLVLLLLACASFLVPGFRRMRGLPDQPELTIASGGQATTDDTNELSGQETEKGVSPLVAGGNSIVQPDSSEKPETDGAPSIVETAEKPNSDATLQSQVEAAPEEAKLTELLSLVNDNTLNIHKREMPAYWQLISKSQSLGFEKMNEASRKDPQFGEFYMGAPKHRGELVSMDINIRRVVEYPPADKENPAKAKSLYEVWGWTEQSKSWLYVCVTPELPPGMVVGNAVNQRARFTGYFFKLLAYHSAKPTASGKPLVAPMLIGKFSLLNSKPQTAQSVDPLQLFFLVAFAVVCLGGFLLRWQFSSRTRRSRSKTGGVEPVRDEATRFDWLDKVATTASDQVNKTTS
jgi:hypothetical protein